MTLTQGWRHSEPSGDRLGCSSRVAVVQPDRRAGYAGRQRHEVPVRQWPTAGERSPSRRPERGREDARAHSEKRQFAQRERHSRELPADPASAGLPEQHNWELAKLEKGAELTLGHEPWTPLPSSGQTCSEGLRQYRVRARSPLIGIRW